MGSFGKVKGGFKKWIYKTPKGADAIMYWDGESKDCVVMIGTKLAKEADGFGKLASAKKLKDELVSKGYVKNNRFVANYWCDKVSTMINVLNGGSVSMPAEKAAGHFTEAQERVYRYKDTRIRCDKSSNECTVLAGSRVEKEAPKFATSAPGAKELKDELVAAGIIKKDVFAEGYIGSLATLLNVINGGSVSATREKEKFILE